MAMNKETYNQQIERFSEISESLDTLSYRPLEKLIDELNNLKTKIRVAYKKELSEEYNRMMADLPHYTKFNVRCDFAYPCIKICPLKPKQNYGHIIIHTVNCCRSYNDVKSALEDIIIEPQDFVVKGNTVEPERMLMAEIYSRLCTDDAIRQNTYQFMFDIISYGFILSQLHRRVCNQLNYYVDTITINKRYDEEELKQSSYIKSIEDVKPTYVHIREYQPKYKRIEPPMMRYNNLRCQILMSSNKTFFTSKKSRPSADESEDKTYYIDRWVDPPYLTDGVGKPLFSFE